MALIDQDVVLLLDVRRCGAAQQLPGTARRYTQLNVASGDLVCACNSPWGNTDIQTDERTFAITFVIGQAG